MQKKLFKITCLTNMHVGSSDTNFNIVDREVEKDPVTGYPIIHGSGLKGALLADGSVYNNSKERADYIFGKEGNNNKDSTSGAYKIFGAKLLARPLRVGKGPKPYILTTTVTAVNDLIDTINSFGLGNLNPISPVNFGDKRFVSYTADKSNKSNKFTNVEGEEAGEYRDKDGIEIIKSFIGEDFAIAAELNDYPLPVIARNRLGKNKNLWYEEFVPYKSLFYALILYPDNDDEFLLKFDDIVQIGGNASVGNGYVKFTEMGVQPNE